MLETELKFQVPTAMRAALLRAVATPAAQTVRLRAQYFDTPDGRLAAAGVALRLRQEGRSWVQTLKGTRDGLAQRLEHEVVLPAGPVVLELGRHDGTPAAVALQEALGTPAGPLVTVFQTDVRRTWRVLRTRGARVELALDIGTVHAAGRRLPLWELELELRRGPIDALYALASRWVQRHGLWLDVRSKAERGVLLAHGLAARPPVGARAPALQRGQSMDAALRAMVGAALAQALPNASALAGGVGGPEHLHQLRVGLRRLRSVQRLFGEADRADPAPDALQGLFRRLGGARDRDVLVTCVWPALMAAGGRVPSLPPAAAAEDPGSVLREPASVGLLLSLMAFAEGAPRADDTTSVHDRAAAVLLRQHRRLHTAARSFAGLGIDDQHRLRRRLKRLRYGVEATQALWPGKACRHYLDGLHPLQDALGQCNDLQMAQALLSTADPASAFALDWLAARHAQAVDAAARALQHWPRVPTAWRR